MKQSFKDFQQKVYEELIEAAATSNLENTVLLSNEGLKREASQLVSREVTTIDDAIRSIGPCLVVQCPYCHVNFELSPEVRNDLIRSIATIEECPDCHETVYIVRVSEDEMKKHQTRCSN